ncbi:MAG TPA: hypothetical protein VJ774_04505 [Actinomycetota bacterium]|nr:hypothetical protein [Actinomycetota bacterium]
MTTPAIVWLVVGLVTTVAALAVLIALIRHLFVVGRAMARFQSDVGPIAAEIGEQAERASARASRTGGRPGTGRR